MNQVIIDLTHKIIDSRYKDLEKQKQLCFEALDYAKKHNDTYAESVGYTYLGEYFIVHNNMKVALDYLNKSKNLMQKGDYWDQLFVHTYSFLGITYEILCDEQNCISHFLDSISMAKKIGDKRSECIILNNLAIIFQQHRSYDLALEYLEQAYEAQKTIEDLDMRAEIFSSLGDLNIQLHRLDEVKKYYKECENILPEGKRRNKYIRRQNCCYYAEKGDKEKASYWAQQIIAEDIMDEADYGSFESYNMLCDAMLKIKDKVHTKQFLELLQASSIDVLEQRQIIEKKRIDYSIMFDSQEKQDEAFLRFYQKNQELRSLMNKHIVKAMEEKIDLDEMIRQKKELELEQKSLEEEANIDEITSLYNRRSLDLAIEKISNMVDKTIGVIMIDVDYFKEYNDCYGHVEGDCVLREVASSLEENKNGKLNCYRYGGDEFICLYEDETSYEIENYIRSVQESLYQKNIEHSQSLCSDRVTLSFGYSNEIVSHELGIYNLLQMADKALYESKLEGRNTYKKK